MVYSWPTGKSLDDFMKLTHDVEVLLDLQS